MQEHCTLNLLPRQHASPVASADLFRKLDGFVSPLLRELDGQIDRRLVRNFLEALVVIIELGRRNGSLLLTHIGEQLLGEDRAPAGTKRVSNLLRCPKWTHELIDAFLWHKAREHHAQMVGCGDTPVLSWDTSAYEKPESRKAGGLCPVRSVKAKRLSRSYLKSPSRNVFVPGFHWLTLLLVGQCSRPALAHMQWWSTRQTPRGPEPTDIATVRRACLQEAVRAFGTGPIHVFDRGFAGSPWLCDLLRAGVPFVIRWPKRYALINEKGEQRPTWQIAIGKRTWEHRSLELSKGKGTRKVGVVAFAVTHEGFDTPLWLVVERLGAGKEPWYLLTNIPTNTADDAWKVVLAYARRWQVEVAFRYNKAELAMQSPRVWTFEGRLKLLCMVSVAYAFLLSMLEASVLQLREWLLRNWCHRTGRRYREVIAPLYRIRWAIAALWLAFSPLAPPGIAKTPG